VAFVASVVSVVSASGPSRSSDDFLLDGAPTARLAQTILEAARRAKERLQARWPLPLSDAPLRMVWFDSQEAFEAEAHQRADGVLALADKARDRALLNGPALRRAGAGAIAQTLQHEFVHVHFARAGVDRLPRWLEEGLAMRLAGERRWADAWLMATDRLSGRVAGQQVLWNEWPDSSQDLARIYRQAYSLTSFFLREYFPQEGEAQLMRLLLRRRGPPVLIDDLWRPHVREALYLRWRNAGGKWGVWITLLTAPTVLFGGVCVPLLILAYLRRRRRAQRIAEAWEEEGPYFSEPATEHEFQRGEEPWTEE